MTVKTVVVTGASSGIGLATADYLHKKGYRVIGLSRSKPIGNVPFQHVSCDISDQSEIAKISKMIKDEIGSIDALVNCAGKGIGGAIEETPIAEIDQLFSVNVRGTILFTQAMIPLLRRGNRAKIINIGSVAGSLVIPFQSFYSMSKASLMAFSEALRMELKPEKIDVTIVLPGDTKTGFTKNRVVTSTKPDSPYHGRVERSIQKMAYDEEHGSSPLAVAKKISKLLNRRSMPVSVTIGLEYKLFLFLQRILPKRLVSWILFQMYGK
jgi:short-subunit dehydrogenase